MTIANRSLLLSFLLAAFLLVPTAVSATTTISHYTIIRDDTTWDKASGPYVLEGRLYVAFDATLTVEPGVRVLADDGGTLSVYEGGNIDFSGTATNPIMFGVTEDDDYFSEFSSPGLSFDYNSSGTIAHTNFGNNSYVGINDSKVSLQNTNHTNPGDEAIFVRRGSLTTRSEVTIHNAKIKNHQVGVFVGGGLNDVSITDSVISDNEIGLHSKVTAYHFGENDGDLNAVVRESKIADNNTYGVKAETTLNTTVVDARDNFWGDQSGPYHATKNRNGAGDAVTDHALFDPWLQKSPHDESTAGNSSVAFIPGFQASRLYFDTGTPLDKDRLWEPENNDDLEDLSFTSAGKSINEVFVGQPIDTINWFELGNFGGSIYQDFFSFLDDLKKQDIIPDWQALPYDWRQRQPEVIDGTVNGLTASSTYQMVDRIENLAAGSDTGRVTIVGHSNGGLVGKLLISKLQDQDKADLIDRLVMIGTPQIGTPKTIGSLLHGLDQDYAKGLIANEGTARGLAENMPGVYGLLPFPRYLADTSQPVIEFGDGEALSLFRDEYGSQINEYAELQDFLVGQEGRQDSVNVDWPQPANANLLSEYQSTYSQLSEWQAPPSTEVTQIAGWGLSTVRGLRYETNDDSCLEEWLSGNFECNALSSTIVKPLITNEGDGTVTKKSSALTNTFEDIFIKINLLNNESQNDYSHANLTEISQTQSVLKSILKAENIDFSDGVFDSAPTSKQEAIMLSVHSPVDITVSKESNTVGVVEKQGGLKIKQEEIPGSTYLELGESKYVVVPKDNGYDINLSGTGSGTFTFTAEELDASGGVIASSTFSNIPVTTSTKASVNLQANNLASSTVSVDINGDGTSDRTVSSQQDAVFAKFFASNTIPHGIKRAAQKRLRNFDRHLRQGKIKTAWKQYEKLKDFVKRHLKKGSDTGYKKGKSKDSTAKTERIKGKKNKKQIGNANKGHKANKKSNSKKERE